MEEAQRAASEVETELEREIATNKEIKYAQEAQEIRNKVLAASSSHSSRRRRRCPAAPHT